MKTDAEIRRLARLKVEAEFAPAFAILARAEKTAAELQAGLDALVIPEPPSFLGFLRWLWRGGQ